MSTKKFDSYGNALLMGKSGPYSPNMFLADKYNVLRDLKRQVKLPNGDTVILYDPFPSNKSNKKLAVYVENAKNNGKIELVYFGHPDYEDYTIHRDEKRRQNYCARSRGIKCQGKDCDLTSPNYWSRSVLWNC